MSLLYSDYRPLVPVRLPIPKDRQFYMHSFDLSTPTVPNGFEDYLEAVLSLCTASGAKGMAHLTIDEKVIKAGMSQRRPKPHVDGCFIPAKPTVTIKRSDIAFNSWTHELPSPAGNWGHGGGGNVWAHGCNNVSLRELARMPVIVAASVPGCKAWRGIFDGMPASDGDLSHIEDQLVGGEVLPANVGYLLSPDCVHESMIFAKDTPRTFIRIALPNDYKF